MDRDLQSRQQARELAEQAQSAFEALSRFSQEKLDRIIAAIAEAGEQNAAQLGELACTETGFGNAADKAEKNRFATRRVYEAIREMKTVGLLNQKDGLWEIGVPVGVIVGIVPSTNPTSTVLYKSLIALKAGCAIVFSPHPGAVNCTRKAAQLAAEAAEAAGCPRGAIGCLSLPSQEAVQELFRHRHTRLILATGGGTMVKAAYSSGKPAIGVGAGNGPAYIHRSADIGKAVSDILRSKTFDNGTICASEQSVIAERCCAEAVKAEFVRQGAYFLSEREAAAVGSILLRADGSMNPQCVGKTAHAIAALAGLSGVPESAKVLLAHETQAGPARPYSREKLCPVLAFFTEENEDKILARVCEVLRGEGAGHTFAMHAQDKDAVRRFALAVPVSRFLVNTPAALGGVGMTTELFPALTLGCGAVGGSSTSNNVGPMELVNLRRVAWGTQASGVSARSYPDAALIDALTEEILKKLR